MESLAKVESGSCLSRRHACGNPMDRQLSRRLANRPAQWAGARRSRASHSLQRLCCGGGALSRYIHPPTAPSWAIAPGERASLLVRRRWKRHRPDRREGRMAHPGASGDEGVLDAAITAANAGKLVVAGYFQPPTQQPDGTQVEGTGHIVVVRPQESFPTDEGPEVVTAGVKNFKSASMKFAFGDHPLAWPDNIQLFVHDTALE